MQTADRLTILLTLKDRTPYTTRWLQYVNHIQCPFRILIADGGSDDSVGTLLADRSRYSRLRLEYIRYPFDQTYKHFEQKVSDALSRVMTPYVMMVDNDDFFIIDGLNYSVRFLDSHPEYSACGGPSIYFEVASSNSNGEALYGQAKGFFNPYPTHSDEQDSALQRVQSYMLPWRSTWYFLSHTRQLRSAWNIVASELEDPYWSERVLESLRVVEGKVATRDIPYYFRQINSPGSYARSYGAERGDMFQRMFRDTWLREFNKAVEVVATAIARKDDIGKDAAFTQARQIYQRVVAGEVAHSSMALPEPQASGTQWPIILKPLVSVARRWRGWQRSTTRLRQAESSDMYWKSHAALRPMYEVLASPAASVEKSEVCS